MSLSGAKAALRGYRLQAMYTMSCILTSKDPKLVFQPEGKEDLAIYRDEHLVQAIQIKAYTNDLTLSDFAPERTESFFHRAAKLIAREGISVEVVSFGPIGKELTGAWAGNESDRLSVQKKLINHGYTKVQVEHFFAKIAWKIVETDEVKRQIFNFLNDSITGGDPENAFDLLLSWLYFASEKQDKIDHANLLEKITAVGKYITARAAHHQEWFTSIVPIEDKPVDNQYEHLSSEFYHGVNALYAHILADLDVPRPDKLEDIDQAFSGGTRTVIIHGASGQGKSTIAWRYLHDYVPDGWRFHIRFVEDRAHAARIAIALAEHLRVIAVPLYIHIDVSPRDLEWTELVRDLRENSNIRILVSIREEDLARHTTSHAELGFPHTVRVVFDSKEAQLIYDQLQNRGIVAYPSFDDAWTRFGGEGPLLEFVHFVTQTESLRARLKAQVRRLHDEVRSGEMKPEELEFLRGCVVATAYEARAEIKSFAAALNLKNPIRTLELFKKEYLLQSSENGRYAEALHPIRSNILSSELCENSIAPWRDAAIQVMPSIPENDLESFLLYTFSRKQDEADILINALSNNCQPCTWTGIAAVYRALLWLGIREYIDSNHDIIKEAIERSGDGWWLMVKSDIGGTGVGIDDSIQNLFNEFQPQVADAAQAFRARQTPVEKVFKRSTSWLQKQTILPESPVSRTDWSGFTDVHFWSEKLGIDTILRNIVPPLDLAWPIEHLSLRSLGEVILSLSYGPTDVFDKTVGLHVAEIISRYRSETNSVHLEESEERIRAHFIVDHNSNEETGNVLHEQAIWRLELLRLIIPNRKAYGTQGYGHRTRIAPLPYDPTEKGGVLVRNLPPRWLTEINGTFINLVNWSRRPSSWYEYTEHTITIREQLVSTLSILQKNITTSFKKNRPGWIITQERLMTAWDKTKEAVQYSPKLPQNAVDEWGFTGEGKAQNKDKNDQDDKSKPDSASTGETQIDVYRPYLKSVQKFLTPLRNYFNQGTHVLAINSHVGKADSAEQREKIIARAKKEGLNPDLLRLSVHNLADVCKALPLFQRAFNDNFGRFVDDERLRKLERKEEKLYLTIWALWYQFANHPEKKWDAADVRSTSIAERALRELRERVRTCLDSPKSEGWQSRILSESIPWEEGPALWISLEVSEPHRLHDILVEITKRLKKALVTNDSSTLEQYVFAHHWRHIIIVPSCMGRKIANGVWRRSAVFFYTSDKTDSDEKGWYFALGEPRSEVWSNLGIDTNVLPTDQSIWSLQKTVSELFLRVDSLSDFHRLEIELDDMGAELFQKYFNAKMEEISSDLTSVVKSCNNMLDKILENKKIDMHPHMKKAQELLTERRDYVLPVEEMEKEVCLDFSDLDTWAEKLQEMVGAIEYIRLLYASDECQQIT